MMNLKLSIFLYMLSAITLILGTVIMYNVWPLIFIDIRSFILVIGGLLLFLVTTGSLKMISRAFFDAVSAEADATQIKQYKKDLRFFKMVNNTVVILGIIGIAVGIIIAFLNMSNKSIIGYGYSLSILSAIYVVCTRVLIFNPFIFAVKNKLIEAEEEE